MEPLVVQVRLGVLDQLEPRVVQEVLDQQEHQEVLVQVDQQEVREVPDPAEVRDQPDLAEALDRQDHQDLLVYQVLLELGEVLDHPDPQEFRWCLKAHTQPVRHTQLTR